MEFKEEWKAYFREPGSAACAVGSAAIAVDLLMSRRSPIALLIVFIGILLLMSWSFYTYKYQDKIQNDDMSKIQRDMTRMNNIVSGIFSQEAYSDFTPYIPREYFDSDSPLTKLATVSNTVAWIMISLYFTIDVLSSDRLDFFYFMLIVLYWMNSISCIANYSKRIKKMNTKTSTYRGVLFSYKLAISEYNKFLDLQK